MGRPKRREQDALFDPELAEMPEGARWREWMGRVEAAIFAAREPLPREALARLVGKKCNLDDLIADIVDELRPRPYELVQVAGGWQMRTKPRHAGAIRALGNGAQGRRAARTDADRTAHRHRDRLSAAGHPRGTVAPHRQGGQPGHHWPARRVWTSSPPVRARRNPARPTPMSRRANSWRCSDWPVCAICPTSKSLEDAGLLQRPEPEIEIDGALGIQEGDSDRIDEAVIYWNESSDTE